MPTFDESIVPCAVGHADALGCRNMPRSQFFSVVRLVSKISAVYVLERKVCCRQFLRVFLASFVFPGFPRRSFSTAIMAAALGSAAIFTLGTALVVLLRFFLSCPRPLWAEGGFLASKIGSWPWNAARHVPPASNPNSRSTNRALGS